MTGLLIIVEQHFIGAPTGTAEFEAQIVKKLLNCHDVMRLFPSAHITFAQFVEACPIIKPRYYSISSSPTKPGQPRGACQITCGLLQLKNGDKTFHGYSSKFLNGVQVGQKLTVFMNPAVEFHLPSDLTKPIVMIGAGTGLAPFMGYMEGLRQAKNSGVRLADNALFFGCRKSSEDYIYKDEISAFVKDGTIKHAVVSFSRDDPEKVKYVQHSCMDQSKLVWQLIKEGAYFYICGSKQMRADVKAEVTKVIMKESGMNATETSHCVLGLWASKHYVEDVWG